MNQTTTYYPQERNFLFDNLKSLLIFLVVFGHILELFLKTPCFFIVHNIIYGFHMPAFVFIAGYFSKNIEKQDSVFFDFLIPYFIFNSLYQILVYKTAINLFTPCYVYWFLLSMFFWKGFLKNLRNVCFVIPFSIMISIYCGVFDDVSRYLSVSRTLVFFPYFLMGYFCQEKSINKIKNMSKVFGIFLLIFGIFINVFLFRNNLIPFEILTGADSYRILNIDLLTGILSRMFLIIMAIVYLIVLINLSPQKELKITHIGKKTLVIYLFHPYLVRIVNKIFKVLPVFNQYFSFTICLIFAIAITTLLGNDLLTNYYKYFFSNISKLFKKRI